MLCMHGILIANSYRSVGQSWCKNLRTEQVFRSTLPPVSCYHSGVYKRFNKRACMQQHS